MVNYNIGKGVYIWQPKNIEGGDPNRIAERFKLAGVQTVAVKICDGISVLQGLETLIQTLRSNDIRVGAWGYSYLNVNPAREAKTVAAACTQYKPDFYLIDVETEVENNTAGATTFMTTLRPAVGTLPLGLNSFWETRYHPIPWAVFLKYCDFTCPQVYWRGTNPIGKLLQTKQNYLYPPGGIVKPMPFVAGDLYSETDLKPTPEQVTQFIGAVESDPTMHGVLMWAADDTETTPELWQAFSLYPWKKEGGPTLPTQPLGWLKVKQIGGAKYSATSGGPGVGSYPLGTLKPIWQVTANKQWAAINSTGDQWLNIGLSGLAEVVWAPPPSTPTEVPPVGTQPIGLIKVLAEGLNVRSSPMGSKIGALKYGDVVPFWQVTVAKWATLDAAGTRWVYVGEPRYVSLTYATTQPPPINPGPQAIGTLKVITEGLNVRSTPLGTVVGALKYGDVASFWQVNTAKWASLDAAGSRWVYVGNPSYVTLTYTSAQTPPPTPAPTPTPTPVPLTKLYNALVASAGGLNVRDKPGGSVVRVAPYQSTLTAYQESNGWAQVDPVKSEWVMTMYLTRVAG